MNEYHKDATEIPDFTSEEIGVIISKMRTRKTWGKDCVHYEDYKKNSKETNEELNIFNVVKRFRKAPGTWKNALIRRNPKKNYTPEDLTTLRDISLLPTTYICFAN